MQALQNENDNRQSNNNKKIILIVLLYLCLTISNRYEQTNGARYDNKRAIDILTNNNKPFNPTEMLAALQPQTTYIGKWNKQNGNHFLTSDSGKFQLYLRRQQSGDYQIVLTVFNGDYKDRGILEMQFNLNDKSLYENVTETEKVTISVNESIGIDVTYYFTEILANKENNKSNITILSFNFQLLRPSTIKTSLLLEFKEFRISLSVEEQEPKLLKLIIFAVVMMFVAYLPFSATMKILKSLYDATENPKHYSLLTICITSMWDTVLSLIAFVYAFENQESLVLFIMPAFLLGLLFTNLQPRLMMLIIHSLIQSTNIRQVLCRFNLIHYGSLILIYPVLIITNLNWILFVMLASIIFPQIYLNATLGVKPKIWSVFYLRYLMGRFVIIFYLKCFSLNIFGLSPDYPLSLLCAVLIIVQYVLLYIQNKYGPKTVIPAFLLDPVYSYKYQEQFNVQESLDIAECAICLTSIALDPICSSSELLDQPSYRLMKTPCCHIYHSQCLLVWMKVKMECPQCRSKLPPLE